MDWYLTPLSAFATLSQILHSSMNSGDLASLHLSFLFHVIDIVVSYGIIGVKVEIASA